MKRKLSFLFLSALTIPFFMGSCSDDKEEQEVKPATDLVVDNNSVTLLLCKILDAEKYPDLMGYWVFSKGIGGTTVFENWGNGGNGLDAQVCLQNINENKPAWGAELPATYNGDKSRFEPIECPHSY